MKKAVKWISIVESFTEVSIINFALQESRICIFLEKGRHVVRWIHRILSARYEKSPTKQTILDLPTKLLMHACLFFPVTTQSGLSSYQLQEVLSAIWLCA